MTGPTTPMADGPTAPTTGMGAATAPPGLMTVDGAAEYLGLSAYTIRALCKARDLAHHRVGPRRGRILISRDACDQYLRRTLVDREPARPPAPVAKPTRPAARGDYQFGFFEPGTLRRLGPRDAG